MNASELELEAQISAIARELAADGGGDDQARVFHLGWWSERMLAWAMAHPQFKTQLFRFVDVFPACADDAEVLRHLEEYFDGVPVPGALELGLDLAEHVPLGRVLSATTARRNITRMARQFIAGATPDKAMRRLRRLWENGEASTVDVLGEKTVTEADADRYTAKVEELVDALAGATPAWPERPHLNHDRSGPLPMASVSVKPTALSPLFGPLTADEGLDAALERLSPTLERARSGDVTIHVDTEHDDVKDLTFALVRRIAAQVPELHLGCVVQAYRKDSFDDLRDLVAWSRAERRVPLQIRLVKGAYWDYETMVARASEWPSPVFDTKTQTDANFERCTSYLLDHVSEVRPAIGSHNLRSLAYALAAARQRGLDDQAVEFQLLYGMAEPVHAALVRMGLRVRAYVPVGELVPGMAYLIRRLLENTSNESFVRQRFAEGRDLDELLAPPGIDWSALPEPVVEPPERTVNDAAHPAPFVNEPHAELRRPGPRGRVVAAVDDAAANLGFTAPPLIGGRAVSPPDELVSSDPGCPSRVVCHSGCAGPAEADAALERAHAGWPAWRATAWRDRAQVLFRAAAILRHRRRELVALEVFEAGKPIPEADADVCEAIDFCEYYGREALRLAEGKPLIQVPGEANAYRYEPRGIAVVIAPWNFPLAIPTGMVTAALVTGNAVVFKPAEQTPGIAFRLVQVLHEAGVPADVLAFLPGLGEDVGAYLVSHPDVSCIAFTGSKAVGLHIIEDAAITRPGQRQVKRVIAEMGGKNPIIVDIDADLDVAVPAISTSAFGYAGQKCSAASRVIAVGSIFERLVDRLAGAAMVVPVGHAAELRTKCGPLIEREAQERVHRYREMAHAEATVIVERDDVPPEGWYVGPTVAVTDNAASKIVTDEIFGPFLTVSRADDFDHALELANNTEYALTGGLFSRSPSRIRRAIAEMRAGNLYVNRSITGALVGRQPFGGYGLSGVGSKSGGSDYLLQFVDPRAVTENTERQGFAPIDE